MSTALLIIDVQHALCHGEHAAFEADRVVANINRVSQRVRQAGGLVVLIQHQSPSGPLAHGCEGWKLAPGLVTAPSDLLVPKTTADAFHNTALLAKLHEHGVSRLIVCGLQSDFCVDTTTRRALALGFPVTLVSDGHSTSDNGVLKAAQISAHHNATLAHIGSFGVRAVPVPASEVLASFDAPGSAGSGAP